VSRQQQRNVAMRRSERAKQFMPFSALKGLAEELEKAEKVLCAPKELLDDEVEELNRRIADIEVGSMVEVEYYHFGEYVTVLGRVKKLDKISRIIRVEDTDIKISNIISVKLGLVQD